MSKNYTTTEAAAKIGVSRQTLHAWIESGQIDAPKPVEMGQRLIRFWTVADIDRARKFKGTLKSGPKPKKK
jgi:excisionase family DNA binding protein